MSDHFDNNDNGEKEYGERNVWSSDSPEADEDTQPVEPTETDGVPPENNEAANGPEPDSENRYGDASSPRQEWPGSGQPPYQNPQNPYSPYGQYNNPYGQYTNPGGGYGNYGYGQNPQNPYNPQNRYWTYPQNNGQQPRQNPQEPQQPSQPGDPKQPKRKNTGMRVFLLFLGLLIGGFVLGFCIYGVHIAVEQQSGWQGSTVSQPAENNSASAASGSSQAQSPGKIPGGGAANAAGITIQPKPSGSPYDAKTVYKNTVQSVVGVETTVPGTSGSQGGVIQGTGIIATKDGYILTNAHVVNNSRSNKVKVVLYNKKEYDAKVVGYDKTSDIAVLRIQANNLSAAVFGNADQLEIGDPVIAIGNPGGIEFASSLTGGYVSALNRAIESHSDNGMTYIQTDAAINPGNSGGPLMNMYGQVVGINSNKIVATGYEGMGFAIPVSRAKNIIDDLIARGYVSGRSRLGITASTITAIQSELSGYPTGVMIRQISPESDLTKSGVVPGDVITKVDGQTVSSVDDLYAVLSKHKAGDTVTLTIFRMGSGQSTNGATREVKTKLLEDKGETQQK
ncbi:MAG: trypsin-like serine protease [Clostridiales bacterium]|jgi:serine protease Do|nr:trypsin-like serine protease [Clostridiales bacterium]